MRTDDASSGWAPGVDYTTQALQTITDVQNIAFADRNKYMGDGDYVNLPVAPFCAADEGLLSKAYVTAMPVMALFWESEPPLDSPGMVKHRLLVPAGAATLD